jgi:hypothetical protein
VRRGAQLRLNSARDTLLLPAAMSVTSDSSPVGGDAVIVRRSATIAQVKCANGELEVDGASCEL